MKKQGILNHKIMNIIAQMGHGDLLVIADAGLPIPSEVERIDLALIKGVPDFLTTLEAVLGELVVEEAIIAEEMVQISPKLCNIVENKLTQKLTKLSHEDFKTMTQGAIAIIRTGECTPYANIILKSGVDF